MRYNASMPVLPETVAGRDSVEFRGGIPGIPWFGVATAEHAMELERICAQHQLHDLGAAAVQIARTELKPEQMQLEVAGDPEGSSEWVIIRSDIRASVDEVLARYAACKNAWLRLAPPSRQDLVCFVYNIL